MERVFNNSYHVYFQLLVDNLEPRELQSATVDCPFQCERIATPFKQMFVGSCVGTIFLFGIIIALSVLRYRRVKRAVQRETDAALRKFEKSKLSQKRQSFKLIDVDF